LAAAGFAPQTLRNHHGHIDTFLQLIRENNREPNAPMIPNAAAPVAMHAFDGSAIRDDYATLENSYAKRGASPGPVALYYNT
ncbi:cellulose biosynthesis protein BcsG, partial [Burkholderia pseudomallei]